MKALFLPVFCLVTACSSVQTIGPKVPDPEVRTKPGNHPVVRPRIEVLHEVQLDGMVAEFLGEKVPGGVSERYGVVGLRFVFEDGSKQSFKPQGQLYFSDWRFDIASPDGANVLLLQDHYGPYHVVRVDRMGEYLKGGEPDWEFGYKNPEGSAWVHESGRWESPTTVAYRAGLTTMSEFEFELQ
jgi:hypothetical protein